MGKQTGVQYVYRNGDGFLSAVGVEGKNEYGPTRATIEEAAADVPALLERQRAAKIARKRAREDKKAATLATHGHASRLQANRDIFGNSQAKEGLSRALVSRVCAGHETFGVADGVEYSHDQHAFFNADDQGFNPRRDIELHDTVPTLVIELKLAQSIDRARRVVFGNIHYSDISAGVVVMIYVPFKHTEATDEAVEDAVFWIHETKDWKPKGGKVTCALNPKFSMTDEYKRSRPLSDLPEALAKRLEEEKSNLIPYGERKRHFRKETTRLGQRAIDAIEDQVLRPMGTRFVPPLSGCEGGADDRWIQFADGSTKSAQVKKVYIQKQGIFRTSLHRGNGSIIVNGKKKQLRRPYSVEDGVDWFIFVALDEQEHCVEYWAATSDDMLGEREDERFITGADGRGGKTAIFVHPRAEDAARLGANVGSNYTYHRERTRAWVRALGPILPPGEAAELKALREEKKRRKRLRKKAKREAAKAAEQAAAAAAPAAAAPGPSTVYNINYQINNNYAAPTGAEAKRQRLDSDIRGFFPRA